MTSKHYSSDVVVIGGGIIGLAISYELLKSGVPVTSIFPKTGDQEGASHASGAMLGAFGEITADDSEVDSTELDFRVAAQRMYPNWLKELCECTGLTIHQSQGTFIIANNEGVSDRRSIRRMKEEADRYDEPAEWVEPEAVLGLRPGPHHIPSHCLYLGAEHSVDSAQLLGVLLKCIESFHTWNYLDDLVIDIKPINDTWLITTESSEILSIPHLVIAAGSRSLEVLTPELRTEAGLPEMFFGKGVSCLLQKSPPIPHTIRSPNRAFACGIHVLPRSNGTLYIGATNYIGVDHKKEGGVQPGELHNLFDEIIHQINTEIRCSRIESIRVGYRPIAANRRPVIGETQLPGLIMATGTYRNGVLMAPKIAQIVSGVLGVGPKMSNPFQIKSDGTNINLKQLVEIGIRDIISFLHEPRGTLPYNRAQELTTYVRMLFEMSVLDGEDYSDLRYEIRRRLHEAPFNETMHKLFYEIIDQDVMCDFK